MGAGARPLPTVRYRSEFTERLEAKGRAEGKAKGRAESVLLVLDARGLSVDDATRGRVMALTDNDELRDLLRRAITVSSADQLFD